MRITCSDCLFAAMEISQGPGSGQMFCHRNPPAVFPIPTPQGVRSGALFPPVTGATWCGEARLPERRAENVMQAEAAKGLDGHGRN